MYYTVLSRKERIACSHPANASEALTPAGWALGDQGPTRWRRILQAAAPSEVAKARIRLVIESVFSTLERQMRPEDHFAKTLPGLAQRIVQRLLALTLGMPINTILDRPPRALAACDRR